MSLSVPIAAAGGATDQLIQIAGAILVLSAFVGVQLDRLNTRGRAYLLLNVLGAGTLAVLAAVERQYGFLLLEGVWTLVAVVSLARLGPTRHLAHRGRGRDEVQECSRW